MSDDFMNTLLDAKRASEEKLISIGLKEDMSNAVCVGTLGGVVFECQDDCPLYIRTVTDGYWIVKNVAGEFGVVRVFDVPPADKIVGWPGDDDCNSVASEVAHGLRFISKIEFPVS